MIIVHNKIQIYKSGINQIFRRRGGHLFWGKEREEILCKGNDT